MDFSQFHFIRPWWFTALIPLAIVIALLINRIRNNHHWQSACDPHLLPHLLVERPGAQQRWPIALIAIAWLLTVLALAGPTWSRLPQPVYSSTAARAIVLDLSMTMAAQDIKPSRMERAKFKVLDMLKDLTQGSTAMVVFAKEAYTVSPLTQDSATIASMVPVLNTEIVPVQGDNMATGLKKAAQLLQQGGAKKGRIILVTDSPPTTEAFDLVKKYAKENISTSVLSIGTVQGAPIPTSKGYLTDAGGAIILAKLDVNGLKTLANDGNGRYQHFTNNNSDIKQLLISDNQHNMLLAKKNKQTNDVWADQGRWLLIPILLLALLGFRRGWLEVLS